MFSRYLPIPVPVPGPNPPPVTPPYSWNTVEVWAKYRVNDPNLLSKIEIGIIGGPPGFVSPGNYLPFTISNTWRTIYAVKTGNWSGWADDNLRVELLLEGTTNPANVGKTIVEVEYFAVRLSDEDAP